MFSRFHLPLPTASWTRALFAPFIIFVACCVDRNYQTDFWHHLARGRAIAESGSLVNRDLFTYTVPGRSFQDANWLSQLAYHHLYQAGGLDLVQFVNALTMAAMMAVVVGMCWRATRSLTLSAALGVFGFLGLWQLLIIRPQSFSMLLFVVLYAVLEASACRRWLLTVPPLILALWSNIHGGFPVGLLLIGSYVLAATWMAWWERRVQFWRDPQWQGLTLCLAISLLATCVNPYGWRVWEYVFHTSGVASARKIDEWLPPGLSLLVSKVWVLSVLGIVVLFAVPGRRPRASEVALVLCFLPLACGSVRMVAWWLLVCLPIAGAQLAALLPERYRTESDSSEASLGTGLIFGVFVLVSVLSLPWLERFNPVLRAMNRTHRTEHELQAAADFLREQSPQGRIFTRFEWGEYVGWSMSPDYRIFMDARIEIYPDRVWGEYSAITRGRADWQTLLDGYDVDCLLLDRGDGGYHAELLPQVEQSPNWEKSFERGRVVIFLRKQTVLARAEE
jgi:hypothetical protein